MKKLNDAWDLLTKVLFCEKTNLIYDSIGSRDPAHRFDHLPYPEEIAQNLPNPNSWGTGMEDSMLNAGPALEAALYLARTEPEKRTEAIRFARKLMNGMELCATVHGVPGFLVRSVSHRDGKSCYCDSSRDQFTLYVYGLWRFFHSEFATASDKDRITRMLSATADYCERSVKPETGNNLMRLDGGRGLVSQMIGVCAHEEYRLPMFYLAAYDCSGNGKYLSLYESLADHALDVTLAMDPNKNWWDIQLMQMQISLAVGWEADPDPERRKRIRKAMLMTAELAEKSFYADAEKLEKYRGPLDQLALLWSKAEKMCIIPGTQRDDGPSLWDGKFYLKPEENHDFFMARELIRGVGNRAVAVCLCADYTPAPDFYDRFEQAADIPDYKTHTSADVCNILQAHYLVMAKSAATELHIFNGDCALDAWHLAGGKAPAIPWRENFLEGKIPAPDTPDADFAAIRAEEVCRMMPDLGIPEEKIRLFYQKIEAQVLALKKGDSAVLWFDACMFDQLLLARIMFLLNRTQANVFLICKDIIWGCEKDFTRHRENAVRLTESDIALFAGAWRAAASGKQAVEDFVRDHSLKQFPFLYKGLCRFIEEFPGADGLGRSERQLIELIRSGKHHFHEIFSGFDAFEEYMFMGDTMCLRMLDHLAERGIITVSERAGRREYFLSGER